MLRGRRYRERGVVVLYADVAVAQRIEASVADDMRAFVEAAQSVFPESHPATIDVGGGVAAFVGPGSPVNQVCGLGMRDRVDGLELNELERFYATRDERGLIALCPLAHADLPADLGRRGWTIEDFENVLVRPLLDGPPVEDAGSDVEIRLATTEDELALWAQAVADGFAAPNDPTVAQLRLSRIAAAREGAGKLLAYIDGRPAGTGELIVMNGLGWLTADTTLPEFRNRGVQTALQRYRMRQALDRGCDTAVSEARPGSPSQRNMERQGFRVVYTRANLRGPK